MRLNFGVDRLSCLLLVTSLSQGFYIPGWSIQTYGDGDRIPLFINKLYSDNSPLQYSFAESPFVCPGSGQKLQGTNLISGSNIPLNLGEVLRGDRITVSDYELYMNRDEEVRKLCNHVIDKDALVWTQTLISEGYVAEWIVDNLPGATKFKTVDRTREYYAAGFKIGYESSQSDMDDPRYFINNHVTLVIRWHIAPGSKGRQGKKVVVGFEVYPKSIGIQDRDAHGLPKDVDHTERGYELLLQQNGTEVSTITIPYTYSVYFREEENLNWANRWDLYFMNEETSSNIHWLALLNSIVFAGLFAIQVMVILNKTIRGILDEDQDFPLEDGKSIRGIKSGSLLDPIEGGASDIQENSLPDEAETIGDVGRLRVLHADVFRTPSDGFILASILGTGIQLIFVAVGLLLLSCFGILNPSFRGGFISFAVGLYISVGLLSGYFSGRLYKTFGGQNLRRNVTLTALLLPGLLFATTFFLNLLAWARASSTALPFTTLLALIALLILVQFPLVYLGGRYGYQASGPFEHPVKPSTIPRQIPIPSWWSSYFVVTLGSGLIHFIAIYVELSFIFKSLVRDKTSYYYQFGFLSCSFLILIVLIAETSIIMTYTQLSFEDYRWWWQSLLVGSSSCFWIFLYCVYFYFFKLRVKGFVSALLFFSYTALSCAVYGILMGTVGFLTAYAFVRKVYGVSKVD